MRSLVKVLFLCLPQRIYRSAGFFIFLLLTSYFILLTSCGRRGDPVLVEPSEERAVEIEEEKHEGALKKQKEAVTIEEAQAGPPAGLTGVYTQSSIILLWNEVEGKDIRYKVYRSAGGGYELAGETVTPAFTDKDVEPNKKYNYRVTAVSATTEGPSSKELIIVTEIR